MTTLVKKEICLLRPAWLAALVLAAVQGFTRPDNPYVAFVLLFGLAILALTALGRETSLNTFSNLLAQPADRIRIWDSKLTVLSAAFVSVFGIWVIAFVCAYFRAAATEGVDAGLRANSYNLFIAICLIATATFTGGLWTTLLLRQLAGAFWLTLLVPITLSGFSGVFLANSESNQLVIAVLSLVLGIYSLAGFLFARWLFFRAQDVGWSGGVIVLPEWKFLSARVAADPGARSRSLILALFKKEIQLQQGVLTGAAALLILHLAVLAVRAFHRFPRNSAAELLASIVWMLWFLLPILLGSISVAEERKLGIMDSQLCLPASRRRQFLVKAGTTLGLGILLGGVVPSLLECAALTIGIPNPVLLPDHGNFDKLLFSFVAIPVAASFALICFFASSLAKNFLQAIGLGIVATVIFWLLLPEGLVQVSHVLVPAPAVTVIVFAIPILALTLAWLTYLNFANFRDGWLLWRRNLTGLFCASLLISAGGPAIYHRAWEFFLPAEPAHGTARLPLAMPSDLRSEPYDNLLVKLPAGRVWFDYLANGSQHAGFGELLGWIFDPLPHSAGPARFISGTGWVDASARYVNQEFENSPGSMIHLEGYAESIGIQKDGTLWVSAKSDPKHWTSDQLAQFGSESDWRQFARGGPTFVLLLKADGTLWGWGTSGFDLSQWPQNWPGLRAFQPRQISPDSDWAALYSPFGWPAAGKADGSLWHVVSQTNGMARLFRLTRSEADLVLNTESLSGWGENEAAFVRTNGTLWFTTERTVKRSSGNRYLLTERQQEHQIGRDANWVAVARHWTWLVALKSDGTLWQCSPDFFAPGFNDSSLTRLGSHHDWIAVTAVSKGVVSLAADGSLWLWPDHSAFDRNSLWLELPKQPQFIANVFDGAN